MDPIDKFLLQLLAAMLFSVFVLAPLLIAPLLIALWEST
jgi:hypothetical protein